MNIEPAAANDAAAILELQQLAYRSEGELYDDFSIPPLAQTLAEVTAEFATHHFFKMSEGDQIVGAVRVIVRDGTCHVGRLTVHPAYQGRGIGTALMCKLEELACGKVARFELFTGHKSERNLRLYRKLGYQEFKREPVSDKLTMVFMEKEREQ